MSEFIEPTSLEEVAISDKTLEAPKKATRKPRAKKLEPLDTSINEEELLEECTPVKKGKGRPKKAVVIPVEPVDGDDSEPAPVKPKRIQSEAQRNNFKKALAQRQANIELRRAAKELEKSVKEAQQEEKKQIIEKKVLKKAKCLKKREILEQTALDDLPSDEDIPDAIIEKVIKKQKAKAKAKVVVPVEPVEPPKSRYNFV